MSLSLGIDRGQELGKVDGSAMYCIELSCEGSVGIELGSAFGISLGLGPGRKLGKVIWAFAWDWPRGEMASQRA
jgi:hypothetical protein